MQEFKLKELCSESLPLAVQIMESPRCQPSHRHDAVEIVYIHKGAGWCAVNGVVHPMFTGNLFLIPVGATHEYCSEQRAELKYVNCLFDFSIFNSGEKELEDFFRRGANQLPDKFFFSHSMQKKLMAIFLEMHKELESSAPFRFARCRSLFIELIVQIIRNSQRGAGVDVPCAQHHLGRVLEYINGHLNEKLPLVKLAAVSGYAPDYFGKLFRREMGTGITEYICRRRLETACYDLEHSSLAIEDIAMKTGFFDASYFIKTFKKYCGMTPLQFRRKQGAGTLEGNWLRKINI